MRATRLKRRQKKAIRRQHRRVFLEQLQDRMLLANVTGLSAGVDTLEVGFDDAVVEQAVQDVQNWRVETADGTAMTLKNPRYDAGDKTVTMDAPGLTAGPHKVFANSKAIGLDPSVEFVAAQQGGGASNKFVVLQPQGDRFRALTAVETGMSPGVVAVGDAKGDGTPTVVVGGLVDDKVKAFTRLDNGSFGAPTSTKW